MRTFFSVLLMMLWAWVIFLTTLVFVFWDLSFLAPAQVWFVVRAAFCSSLLVALGMALLKEK